MKLTWVTLLACFFSTACGIDAEPSIASSLHPTIDPAAVAPARAPTALGALPWADRIGIERALAEHDARFAPRPDSAGVLLESTLSGSITARGASIKTGEATTTIALASIRRGSVRTDLSLAGVPVVRGAEVRHARAPGVVEWWRALPSGLEHGVTIASRPEGEGSLVLEVAIEGPLRAEARGDDTVALLDTSGRAVARYAHLLVVDADGARVRARMSVRAGAVHIEVDDAFARYPIVVDPLVATEDATLLASGAAANDRFGQTVSLSADGTTALVGAFLDDTIGGVDAGSARVFVRSGFTWSEQAFLLAFDGTPNGCFGHSVSLSADGSTALVGVPYDNTGAGFAAGSARVFVRSGGTWSEQAALHAAGAAPGDLFAFSVSLSADGSIALVGAPWDDTARGTDAGSVHVFERVESTWTERATLVASDGAPIDRFGWSVALSADGSTALAGAPLDDTAAGADAGSAYAFVRGETAWSEHARLVATGGAAGDGFGRELELSSDGSVAVVGVPQDDTAGGTDAGSARVFVRSGTAWSEQATLVAASSTAGDYFGRAVTVAGEGSTLLVGVRNGARVYVRNGAMWTEESALVISASDVSLSSDGATALVGISDDDITGTDTGSARIFSLRRGLGDGCSAATQCGSGICVDGVCCDAPCGAGAADCRACSVAAGGTTDGRCGPLAAGAAATTTCRPATDACDAAEVCSTTSTECPADALSGAGTECRPAAGACDVAEVCDGTNPSCPADALAAAGTECRAAAGACDVVETCDGATIGCPLDTVIGAGTECRATAGVCDVAESCDGANASCPLDVFVSSGTECRAVAGACDVAEACDGANAGCPGDGAASDGTSCVDADPCNGAEVCVAGTCTAGADLHCDDGDPCTADECDAPSGCSHGLIAGCASDGGARDGGASDAGPDDGGGADAEVVMSDGGSVARPAADCGCRAAGVSRGRAAHASLTLVVLLGLLAIRRRRARS